MYHGAPLVGSASMAFEHLVQMASQPGPEVASSYIWDVLRLGTLHPGCDQMPQV